MAGECAGVAKLVDAPDLGSGAVRRGGSSPSTRTTSLLFCVFYQLFRWFLADFIHLSVHLCLFYGYEGELRSLSDVDRLSSCLHTSDASLGCCLSR